jgi:hypothetical protein
VKKKKESGEKGVDQDPEVHPGDGARLEEGLSCGVGSSSGESADEEETTLRGPSVIRGLARFHLGYGSSGEESSGAGESILVGTDESMGEGVHSIIPTAHYSDSPLLRQPD